MKKCKLFGCVFAAATLVACSSNSDKTYSLYDWNGDVYPQAVYQYINQEGDPQTQLEELEKTAQLDDGSKVPPGLYAQIGLLYGQLGNATKMVEFYQKEMQAFPESSQYINLLLNKGKKSTSPDNTNNIKKTVRAKK